MNASSIRDVIDTLGWEKYFTTIPWRSETLILRLAAAELELCTLVYMAERIMSNVYAGVNGSRMVTLILGRDETWEKFAVGVVYYHPFHTRGPWDHGMFDTNSTKRSYNGSIAIEPFQAWKEAHHE
jgi:hypothetical protein